MESVLQDLRFTVRQLLKNKSFTLTAILSLALGIGAATAVFSVVYGVLLDPYPYKDNNRMVHVQLIDKDGRLMTLVINTGPELAELKQAKCVDEIFMQRGSAVTVTGSSQLPVSVHFGVYSPKCTETGSWLLPVTVTALPRCMKISSTHLACFSSASSGPVLITSVIRRPSLSINWTCTMRLLSL